MDEIKYRGMIDSFLYLTTSQQDIMFNVCKWARYQSASKESHLTGVERIFWFLVGTINYDLWYSKSANFNLIGFSYSDFAGNKINKKSNNDTC